MSDNNRKVYPRGVTLMIDCLLGFGLLVFDQFTKKMAILHLKDQLPYVLINETLELQYLENRGSAFGMFQNQKLFILLVSAIFMLVLLYVLFRLPQQKKYLWLHLFITMIISGGLGNMIDRFRWDYVVDFISFVLIHYPIFNVADIYVVIGTIGLAIMLLFVYKEADFDFLILKKKEMKEN